jgi:hypothetical protein
MTLICKCPHSLPSGELLYNGDELQPGLLDQATIDLLLDQDILVEVPTRLSSFALLHSFAGVGDVEVVRPHPFPELCIDSAAKEA